MTSKQKLKQLLNTPELFALLNDEKWDELMNKLPIQTRPVLLELLRDSGVDEKEVNQLQLKYGIMYGIKYDGYTVTIGAPDKSGIHNVGCVSNQGMQGGRQLGFMTPKDAEELMQKLDGKPHVYTMQPKTVVTYKWIKVNTIHGPAYAALEAIGKFKNLDKTLKEKAALLQELQSAILTAKTHVENPEYSTKVKMAASQENLSTFNDIRDIFESSFEVNDVEFEWDNEYTNKDDLIKKIESGRTSSIYFSYNLNEPLNDSFLSITKAEIRKKFPKLEYYLYCTRTSQNATALRVSFKCTYDSSEAEQAKKEVVAEAEKLIQEKTAELEKVRAELT